MPAWIARAVPPPILAWRVADVLGTPIPEGIAVNRLGTLAVNVVDSRLDPPEIVRERDLGAGKAVRWLYAGRESQLPRDEIAVDVAGAGGEAAWVLRVTARGLGVVRVLHGDRFVTVVRNGRRVISRADGS